MSSAESDTPEPVALLTAPTAWQSIDFISDLHLQAGEPATAQAFERYLQQTRCDALFILGDLFEVWVGDDALESGSFEQRCARWLHEASRRMPVYFMHGNRDFLAGGRAMAAWGATLLQDPTVLAFASQRWLLSHGDALCLTDTDYMAFRATVRADAWQRDFLARPLAQRRDLARQMRTQSAARKQSARDLGDVDNPAAIAWLRAASCQTLIHGHTHRPADHVLGSTLSRVVLSDWDCAATPPRAEALRLTARGPQRIALT